jgi:adenosine deaminase
VITELVRQPWRLFKQIWVCDRHAAAANSLWGFEKMKGDFPMRLAAAMLTLAALAPAHAIAKAPPSAEARTAAALNRIAGDSARLRMFLQAMPKGGDLHNHLGGSVYAEDFLAWADEAGLCIATDTDTIVPPPCDAPNRVPARGLAADAARYERVIDAISTRGFENGVGDPRIPGHDRFFSTFAAFGAASRGNNGRMIAAAREQAAYDRVSYLELMTLPRAMLDLMPAVMAVNDSTNFEALARAIAPGMPAAVTRARADMDHDEANAAAIEGCGGASPTSACTVETRYLVSALRNLAPAQVFAQLALGFALAEVDPRFVGINIVAPEHEPVPRRDYALHMRMIAFLHARHPSVAMSLHAGELTLGLVPPRDLRFHIHDAIAVAGARRIGHGVDIAYEADAPALLRRMASDHVAVEINLTSNAVILGVKGKEHPLKLYRAAGVPVVLSTDDEGVSRSDMTNEYLRAVTEQGMRYPDLKQIARDGLQYAFVQGPSLWVARAGGARVPACANGASPTCTTFLATSPRATLQWKLERDLAAFEAASSKNSPPL